MPWPAQECAEFNIDHPISRRVFASCRTKARPVAGLRQGTTCLRWRSDRAVSSLRVSYSVEHMRASAVACAGLDHRQSGSREPVHCASRWARSTLTRARGHRDTPLDSEPCFELLLTTSSRVTRFL